MAMHYYKGQKDDTTLGAKVPADVLYSAIDVTYDGTIIFKCNVDDTTHQNILNLGNTEILYNDVITEIKNLFGNLYSDSEIAEWRDTII